VGFFVLVCGAQTISERGYGFGGDSEQGWVTQTDLSPSWSDGTGWMESHGNKEDARVALETFFPARADSWYLAWVWSDASVYGDSGFWGFGASSVHFDATTSLVIFGSL
jgi:hypothetical protein